MKVYVVIENNGEMYEDNCEWINRIFRTEKSAMAYVNELTNIELKKLSSDP